MVLPAILTLPHGELVEPRTGGFAVFNIQTGALTPSARFTFPLWSAMRPVETDRSWGLETPHTAVGVDRKGTSSALWPGGPRRMSRASA